MSILNQPTTMVAVGIDEKIFAPPINVPKTLVFTRPRAKGGGGAGGLGEGGRGSRGEPTPLCQDENRSKSLGSTLGEGGHMVSK